MARPPKTRASVKTVDWATWSDRTSRMVRSTTSDSASHVARCALAASVIEVSRSVGDIVSSGVWIPARLAEELGTEYRHWK